MSWWGFTSNRVSGRCAEIRTVTEAAPQADAVFVGTLTTTRAPLVQTSTGDLVAKEFTVTEVRKGEVAATTEVLTAPAAARPTEDSLPARCADSGQGRRARRPRA